MAEPVYPPLVYEFQLLHSLLHAWPVLFLFFILAILVDGKGIHCGLICISLLSKNLYMCIGYLNIFDEVP